MRKWLEEEPNRIKGEIVLVVEGKTSSEEQEISPQAEKALRLMRDCYFLKKLHLLVVETLITWRTSLLSFWFLHLYLA